MKESFPFFFRGSQAGEMAVAGGMVRQVVLVHDLRTVLAGHDLQVALQPLPVLAGLHHSHHLLVVRQ